MTGTQTIMMEAPFKEKIVDNLFPFSNDDPVVLTQFVEDWSSVDFNSFSIFDKASWVTFITAIYFSVILIVVSEKYFIKREKSLFHRISNSTFILVELLLGKGKIYFILSGGKILTQNVYRFETESKIN